MKKMALITLHSVKNYGSILQTYATQKYFEKLGYKVTVIDFRRPWETPLGYWIYLNDKSIKGILRNIMYFPSKIIQYFRFNDFLKKRINLSRKLYRNSEDFINAPVIADVYCTGSDQVWNSGWNEGIIPEYFLEFVKNSRNRKKISFAASFGSSVISKCELNKLKSYLEDYDLITVREKKSEVMLKTALGLEALEILDPTLQMEPQFWEDLCKKERYLTKKYILLIQLNRNHEFDHIAIDFAKRKNHMLVRLCLRVDQIFLPGHSVVIPKVEDYIRLIRDAEYVLTDSFHAISFCLNLNKQFYCFYPLKYSERLKSILQLMELEKQIIKKSGDYIESPINYNHINRVLSEKRKEAKQIIVRALIDE